MWIVKESVNFFFFFIGIRRHRQLFLDCCDFYKFSKTTFSRKPNVQQFHASEGRRILYISHGRQYTDFMSRKGLTEIHSLYRRISRDSEEYIMLGNVFFGIHNICILTSVSSQHIWCEWETWVDADEAKRAAHVFCARLYPAITATQSIEWIEEWKLLGFIRMNTDKHLIWILPTFNRHRD